MEDGDREYVTTRRIGDAAVTCINDGTVLWAPELVNLETGESPALPGTDALGRIPVDHHAVHIRLGTASVLVDAGLDDPASAWSEHWLREWAGARRTPGLQAGLARIGVGPGDVTHVIITHAHYDHIAGLTLERDGLHIPRYPNARVFLGRGEWEGNPERENQTSEAAIRLGAIERSGLLELVDGDLEVVPGLWMVHAPGESPGHSIVRLDSGGERFYALGDLFHHASEVEHPDWSVPWADRATMRASRRRLMEEAAATRSTAVFTHESFPPWGRVVPADSGYLWRRD